MNTPGLVVSVSGEGDAREAALTELRKQLDDGLARKGLNKTQLAARAALSRTTVHAAFQPGGPVPSAQTVAALAGKLGLPVEELLELRRAAAGETGPAPRATEGPGKPIGQWNPHDLEVHPAGLDTVAAGTRSRQELPSYVRRAHDHALAKIVGESAGGFSRMLILVGPSSTGKTRACWEAVQVLADQGWRLWHPFDPTRAEATLAELDRVTPRTVVWLNEAQHYLGYSQFGERIAAALHTLLTHPDRRPVLVLGTLWPEYAEAYALLPEPGTPDPHSRVRELLIGRTTTVPDTFDQEALDDAIALARGGDRLLADALTRARDHGRLAQDLAGAPELLRRYEQGTPGAKALLEAAMDARRLGVGLHLPQSFLIDAAVDYLSDHDYDQLGEVWVEAAFADLARPVHGKQAPLRRTTVRRPRRSLTPSAADTVSAPARGPVFRLADYLEQHGRTTRRRLCPPTSFWEAAYAHLTGPDDLTKLADAADRRYRMQWAFHLRCRAADAGHPDSLCALGQLREEAGDRPAAETLYWRAVNAGHLEAHWYLARLREEAGDTPAAEDLDFQAVEAGQPLTLWLLTGMQARPWGRDAADAIGFPTVEASQSLTFQLLAAMRTRSGGREAAEALFRRAADAGHLDGFWYLARLREEAGDTPAAKTLYQRGADGGHPESLFALGRLREEAGDTLAAETLYRRAVEVDDGNAYSALVRLREETGDPKAAEALAIQAADAGHYDAVEDLAEMRARSAGREAAEAVACQAAAAGVPGTLWRFARMREEVGDTPGAEALYQRAADSGIPDAFWYLGRLREKAGDRSGAEAFYRSAAETGVPDGLRSLVRMLVEAGDPARAVALAWQAADAGLSVALEDLARLREEAGDRSGAEALCRRAADAAHGLSGFARMWWPHGLDPDGSLTRDRA